MSQTLAGLVDPDGRAVAPMTEEALQRNAETREKIVKVAVVVELVTRSPGLTKLLDSMAADFLPTTRQEERAAAKNLAVNTVLSMAPAPLPIGGIVTKGTSRLLPTFTRTTVDDIVASSRLLEGQTTRGAFLLEKRVADGAIDAIQATQANAEQIIRDVLGNPLRTQSTQRFGQLDVVGQSFGQEIAARVNTDTGCLIGFRTPDF